MCWRGRAIRALLALLNGRLLNPTPCAYGFIGNVDAFSIENLRSEVRQRPDLTVARLVAEAEDFAACGLGPGAFTVIEDAESRRGTARDLHELRLSLSIEAERLCPLTSDGDEMATLSQDKKTSTSLPVGRGTDRRQQRIAGGEEPPDAA